MTTRSVRLVTLFTLLFASVAIERAHAHGGGAVPIPVHGSGGLAFSSDDLIDGGAANRAFVEPDDPGSRRKVAAKLPPPPGP